MVTTLRNLQGLRGIACLLVVGIHLGGWEANFGIAREFLRPFLWFGYAGVDLFFVISGFIIAFTQAGHFGQPHEVPGYLFRRIWRVYPPFWAMMLIAVPLTSILLAEAPVTAWGSWLTLTPTKFPNSYIPPAWTLNYEVIFYAVFGFFLLLPRRVGPWALVAWAGAVAWFQFTKTDDSFHAATIGEALVTPYIWEFLAGCAVAYAVKQGCVRYGRTAILAGLAWAACGIVLMHPGGEPYALCIHLLPRVLVFAPAAALLVYGCIAAEHSGTLTFPKWLRATGDASYSIYLWHGPIGICLHFSILWWPHHTLPHLAWIALMLTFCLGGGFLFHYWVERPLLNLAKRKPKVREAEPVVVEERVTISVRQPELAGSLRGEG